MKYKRKQKLRQQFGIFYWLAITAFQIDDVFKLWSIIMEQKSRWYLIDMLLEALPRGYEDQIIPTRISLINLLNQERNIKN
jgi:hypothetical protein